MKAWISFSTFKREAAEASRNPIVECKPLRILAGLPGATDSFARGGLRTTPGAQNGSQSWDRPAGLAAFFLFRFTNCCMQICARCTCTADHKGTGRRTSSCFILDQLRICTIRTLSTRPKGATRWRRSANSCFCLQVGRQVNTLNSCTN